MYQIMDKCGWNPDLGWFADIFDLIVKFGGVAIIFCFALVNFAGSPLKTAFFILLILAIVCYVIVLAAPDFFYNLFNPEATPISSSLI